VKTGVVSRSLRGNIKKNDVASQKKGQRVDFGGKKGGPIKNGGQQETESRRERGAH